MRIAGQVLLEISLLAAAGAAVWLRQMVLGPGRELCIHAEREIELPSALALPLRLPLRGVVP